MQKAKGTSKNPAITSFLKSQHTHQTVSYFLRPSELLGLNLVNRYFYEFVVPKITKNRQMYPSLNPETHFFLNKGDMYGINMSNYTQTRLVDFEEDQWRHDNHYVIRDAESTKPELIWKQEDLKKLPDDVKLEEEDEIMMQYVIQLSKTEFLVFPVKSSINLQKGLFITLHPDGKHEYRRTAELPEKLLKPGMQAQYTNNRVSDVVFLGGNEKKQCYSYNLESNTFREAGTLPTFHLVTQQNTAVYND